MVNENIKPIITPQDVCDFQVKEEKIIFDPTCPGDVPENVSLIDINRETRTAKFVAGPIEYIVRRDSRSDFLVDIKVNS